MMERFLLTTFHEVVLHFLVNIHIKLTQPHVLSSVIDNKSKCFIIGVMFCQEHQSTSKLIPLKAYQNKSAV